MKYGVLFSTVALLLAITAIVHQGWVLLFLWPALSFGVIALGYLWLGPGVYGKSPRGILSPFHQLLLLPYLLYYWSMWYLLRLVKREPAHHQLTDNLWIGRRLFSHELPEDIDHVIDLTCEFNEPHSLRSKSYHSFQILDGFVPSSEQLRNWTFQAAKLPGKIYIHCAEGHGRTGLFAAALLLHLGLSPTPEAALTLIRSKRPQVRLGQRQLAMLHAAHATSGNSQM